MKAAEPDQGSVDRESDCRIKPGCFRGVGLWRERRVEQGFLILRCFVRRSCRKNHEVGADSVCHVDLQGPKETVILRRPAVTASLRRQQWPDQCPLIV